MVGEAHLYLLLSAGFARAYALDLVDADVCIGLHHAQGGGSVLAYDSLHIGVAHVVLSAPCLGAAHFAGGRELPRTLGQQALHVVGLAIIGVGIERERLVLAANGGQGAVLLLIHDGCVKIVAFPCPVDIASLDYGALYVHIVDGEACGGFCLDVVGQSHAHQGGLSKAVSVAACAGSYARVVAWVEYAKQEPSVASAAPTPIEVE